MGIGADMIKVPASTLFCVGKLNAFGVVSAVEYTPVPDRLTKAVPVLALLVIVSVAARSRIVVGEKLTLTVQYPPANGKQEGQRK